MISTWLNWNINGDWVHLDDFQWFFYLQFAELRRQSSFACCRIFSQEKEKLNFQWWHLQNESTQPMWLPRVTMVHLEMTYHLSEVPQNLPTPNHLPHQKMLSTNCLQNECLNDGAYNIKSMLRLTENRRNDLSSHRFLWLHLTWLITSSGWRFIGGDKFTLISFIYCQSK